MTLTTAPVRTPGTSPATAPTPYGPPVLDVVIPVYNEQAALERSVRRLHDHLTEHFPYSFRITVADNASTDATLAIADTLQAALEDVRVVHLDQKGRGRALQAAWSSSDAAVLAYMDVDLSTDLNAVLPLVAPLVSGHSDLAIGTRLARSSRVVRGPKREFISRNYNFILRRTLAARFSDAQCGFKAIRSDVAELLLPMIEDTGWFFDTELLVLAERAGLRIAEVPVDWVDDPDSRVDIIATAVADLKGVARLGRALTTGALPLEEIRTRIGRQPLTDGEHARAGGSSTMGQAMRFAGIGVVSTIAYLLLFTLLRSALGAQSANLVALLLTALANTAANRRLTFGLAGRTSAEDHLRGLVVFGIGLVLTSGSLSLLHSFDPDPGRWLELGALFIGSATATLVRFFAFRLWIFPSRTAPA